MTRGVPMIDPKLTARLVHWIMAVGFVFMWGCGDAMTTLAPNGDRKGGSGRVLEG